MKYAVEHTTTYAYDDLVSLCHSQAHLQPRGTDRQTLLQWDLRITPFPDIAADHRDYFQNPFHAFTIQTPHRRLTVTARAQVNLLPLPALPGLLGTPAWEQVQARMQCDSTPEILGARQYLLDSPLVRTSSDFRELALSCFTPGKTLLAAAQDLTARIHQEFTYDPRATDVATPLEQALAQKRGVCQDFAHIQLACFRALGLAARYVSGYLFTSPAPGQRRLAGADASHAWVALFCPELGWLDFDPTNNLMPSDQHITVGWGRDYSDVCPLRGIVLGGGRHEIYVSVDVQPLPALEVGTPPRQAFE